MKGVLSTFAAASILCVVSSAAWSDGVGGGVFIPVQDGSSHDCIDVTKSTVSISLVTAQLRRTDRFWKTSKSLGVKIDVRLLNQSGQPFDFPRGRQLSVSSYKGEIGMLPMVFPVMAKYSLVDPNDKRAYVSIGLDVFLINIETQSGLTKGISSFFDFSKNLPLPANPYFQGVQLFGEFAQKIIDADIQSAEDKLPAATLAFDLASSNTDIANCEKQRNSSWRYPILRDGIIAVMWDHDGKPEDGFVHVNSVDKYCFYPTTTRQIAFAAKANDTCPPAAQAKPLYNPLIAFAVDKWARQPTTVNSFNVGPLDGANFKPALSFSSAAAVVRKEQTMVDFHGNTSEGTKLMRPKSVKTYFDAINTDSLRSGMTLASVNNTPEKAATVREIETAIALHRCGLLGISPNDCL